MLRYLLQKRGPALHTEDKSLVEEGHIKLLSLYTIRRDEVVHDNVLGHVGPLSSEIIKIRGHDNSRSCLFLDLNGNTCMIYDHRPLECRILQCWDTLALERIYGAEHLTRRDFLAHVEELWDVVEDHEERCAYRRVAALRAAPDRDEKEEELKKVSEILRYDMEIRRLVVEEAGVDPAITDFIFGRSMADTLGLSVIHRNN